MGFTVSPPASRQRPEQEGRKVRGKKALLSRHDYHVPGVADASDSTFLLWGIPSPIPTTQSSLPTPYVLGWTKPQPACWPRMLPPSFVSGT